MRNGSKVLVQTVTAVSALFAASHASAAHFKTGLWHVTGHYEDSNGVRVECRGMNCAPPLKFSDPKSQADNDAREKKQEQVCVATDILQDFADKQLANYTMMIGRIAKNCKATDLITSDTGRSSSLICDELTVSQQISYPDDQHLAYTTKIKGTAESGPNSGGSTIAMGFEWIGADCGDATNAIQQIPQVAPKPNR